MKWDVNDNEVESPQASRTSRQVCRRKPDPETAYIIVDLLNVMWDRFDFTGCADWSLADRMMSYLQDRGFKTVRPFLPRNVAKSPEGRAFMQMWPNSSWSYVVVCPYDRNPERPTPRDITDDDAMLETASEQRRQNIDVRIITNDKFKEYVKAEDYWLTRELMQEITANYSFGPEPLIIFR
jgi:hypothetical protein